MISHKYAEFGSARVIDDLGENHGRRVARCFAERKRCQDPFMVPPGSEDSSPGESQEPRKRPLAACLPPRRNITVPDTLSALTPYLPSP